MRVFVIVLDSLGVGALPDADRFGDAGAHTLDHLVAAAGGLRAPNLVELGLGCVPGVSSLPRPARPKGAFGRAREASPGKDTSTGHWEMMGCPLERAFPVFAGGFPASIIDAFVARTGVPGILGNTAASGTEIIARLGVEHIASGKPIVYTSADSVFQIAAHEGVVPVADLYRYCEIAFDIVGRGLGVGRVIARPFVGDPGAFRRTANRHDYALTPPEETVLDRLTAAGHPVVAVGKIKDLFAGRGIARHLATASDDEGMDRVEEAMAEVPRGLIWANLVDFDALYGHRNDVDGYARNLERFDARLSDLLPHLRASDLLVVTADHGNDPTTPSTDHSREYVPLLAVGTGVTPGVSLGTRATFADLGQTIAANFGVAPLAHGTSFLDALAPATA
jgi:phosphopentomutase